MTRRSLPLSQVYRLLEPGPVVLVTTAGPERPDVMAMSWHNMMEFEPPLVGCVISGRNLTFDLLQAAGECVIHIPGGALARQVVKAWVRPSRRPPQTLHHRGRGSFMVAGEVIRLRSGKK